MGTHAHVLTHCMLYTVTGMFSHLEGTTSGLRPFKNLLYNIILILTGSWSIAFSMKNIIFRVSIVLLINDICWISLYHTDTVNSFSALTVTWLACSEVYSMFLHFINAVGFRLLHLISIFKNLTCNPQAISLPAADYSQQMDVKCALCNSWKRAVHSVRRTLDPVSCISMMLLT